LSRTGDFILWYGKDRDQIKYRQLFVPKKDLSTGDEFYKFLELPNSKRRALTAEERAGDVKLPDEARIFGFDNLQSQGPQGADAPFDFEGQTFRPNPHSHWKAHYPVGMERLREARRLGIVGQSLRYIRYVADNPVNPLTNTWVD